MSFLRVKKIKGNEYGYLVSNKWTAKGPRQTVGRYLGRVYRFKGKKGVLVDYPNGRKEFLIELIKYELGKLKDFGKSGIEFNAGKLGFFRGRKGCVLGLNQGYMCDYTLSRILRFRKSNDLEVDSVKLAKFFIEAGFAVPQEYFIEYFERL